MKKIVKMEVVMRYTYNVHQYLSKKKEYIRCDVSRLEQFFLSDVVLETVNMASRDRILYQIHIGRRKNVLIFL